MSAHGPETAEDYSKHPVASGVSGQAPRGSPAVRLGLAAAGLTGAGCLVAASLTPVVELAVPGAAAEGSSSGLDRHGPALLLAAALAVAVLVPAARGVRAAMAALVAAGALALGIAVVDDVPALDESGPVTVLGEEAEAGAGPGFFLETLGGTLLVLAGGGLLLLPAPDARTPPSGAAPGAARGMGRARYQR